MLHVNNNDNNDELFRRASENYPLKTDGADWEALQAKLQAANTDTPPQAVAKRKNNRFLLLLLLLIPLGIFEGKYGFIRKQFSGNDAGASSNQQNSTKGTTVAENKTSGSREAIVPKKKIVDNTQPQLTTPLVAQSTGSTNQSTTAAQPNTTGQKNAPIVTNTGNDNDRFASGKQRIKAGGKTRVKINAAVPTSDDENNSDITRSKAITKKTTKGKHKATVTNPDLTEDKTPVSVTTEPTTTNDNPITTTTNVTTTSPVDEKKDDLKPIAIADTPKKEIAKKEDRTTAKKEKEDKKKRKKAHLYAGFVAGPDISTIKLQSVSKVGFNYGLLVGYKINKHFAIETGLLKDKKKYGTDSKYFTLKGYTPQPGYTMGDVVGECKMMELPLNITYSFGIKSRSSWFASAGVSSYFMESEYYAYNISYYGIDYPYASKYKNKSTSMFTMINLSMGYTIKLGKIGDLRIEPFAKLPVKKIGSGSLPIQSGGIFFGLTRTIF